MTVRASRRRGRVLVEIRAGEVVDIGVALAAFQRRRHVVARLRLRSDAPERLAVVAARAGRTHRRVPRRPHGVGRKARCGVPVACAAVRRRDDVGRRLARRRLAVVAVDAVGVASPVSIGRAVKRRRVLVAGGAVRSRRDVGGRLALCVELTRVTSMWHELHVLEVTAVCFMTPAVHAVSVFLWQPLHCTPVTGMWPGVNAPLWQELQFVSPAAWVYLPGPSSSCSRRRGVAGLTVLAAGRHVAGRNALGAVRALRHIVAVVAAVAARRRHGRYGSWCRSRSLPPSCCGSCCTGRRSPGCGSACQARRRRAVVAGRAVRVASCVRVCRAVPARVVLVLVWQVLQSAPLVATWPVDDTQGAVRALGRILAVMAAVAPRRRHGRMAHGVGREARRRVLVAVAALDAGHRDVGRAFETRRRRAVVAGRAVGVASGVRVRAARPSSCSCSCWCGRSYSPRRWSRRGRCDTPIAPFVPCVV